MKINQTYIVGIFLLTVAVFISTLVIKENFTNIITATKAGAYDAQQLQKAGGPGANAGITALAILGIVVGSIVGFIVLMVIFFLVVGGIGWFFYKNPPTNI